MDDEDEGDDGGIMSRLPLKGMALFIVAVVVIGLILTGLSLRVVPAGHKGVITTSPGGPSYEEVPEGWTIIPFWFSVETLPYMTQQISAIGMDAADDNIGSIQATSNDNLLVLVDANLLFRIPADKVADVRIQYGDVTNTVIIPLFRSVPRDVIAKYDAFALRGELRGAIEVEISSTLEVELAKYDVVLVQYAMQGIRLDESVEQAIEAKKIAEQNLIRAQLEYQIALIQAAAIANSTVILAEGQARAVEIITNMFAQMDNSTLNAYLLWFFIQALQDPDSNVQYVIIWDGEGIPVIIQPAS